jgi:hypothetical protein
VRFASCLWLRRIRTAGTRLLEGEARDRRANPDRASTEKMPQNRLLDQARRSLSHRVARTRAQKD